MPNTIISINCFSGAVAEALRAYSRYLAGKEPWGWGPAAAGNFLEELGLGQLPEVPLDQKQYEAFARIAKYNAKFPTNRQLKMYQEAITIANDWLQKSCKTTLDEMMSGAAPQKASLKEVVTAYKANFDSAARALKPVPPVYSPPPSSYWDPVYSGPPSALMDPVYSPPPGVLAEIPPELAQPLPSEAELLKLTGETFVD